MEFDGEVETFQRQALEIRELGADFDPTSMPQTGEEYLMHMLYERKRCPAVVVCPPDASAGVQPMEVTIPAVHMEQKMQTPPPGLLPTFEWKSVQATDFEETRERINFLRQELSAQHYENALEPPLVTDAEEWRNFCCKNLPLLSTILRLNQRTLENLLDIFSDWFRCDKEHEEEKPLQEETTKDEGTTQGDEAMLGEETMQAEEMMQAEETVQGEEIKTKKANLAQEVVQGEKIPKRAEALQAPDIVPMQGEEILNQDETKPDPEIVQEPPINTSLSSSIATATTAASNTASTIDLSGSDQWLGSWLYAVLTCLHLPIEPNVHSTLRDIARSCMRLRSRLLPQDLEKAVPYNLFIYLIAKVFDQLDFVEFV